MSMIAFWGYVEPETVHKYKKLYPSATWLDLDINYNVPKTNILPDAYCRIIKNIFDNSFYFKDDIIKILAPIGKDKCDNGFFAANILKDFGFDVEMLKYEDVLTFDKLPDTPISKSNLPLKEKIQLITSGITNELDVKPIKCKGKFGFWGVPPNDLTILDMFPDETHVFGWCRCVEARNPANIELEMFVDKTLPTVFYAQTFCAKNQLAKYLANKYNGLYIDVDGFANNSVRAKIEAFLRLRNE